MTAMTFVCTENVICSAYVNVDCENKDEEYENYWNDNAAKDV